MIETLKPRNQIKTPRLEKILTLLAIISLIVAVTFIMLEYNRRITTQYLVNKQAKIVVKTHGKNYTPPKDVWGTTLHWNFQPDPKIHVAHTLSAGHDKTFNTKDDIHGTATDYNKTGIVAEWAGSKVKESVKGFFKGLVNPSDHTDPAAKGPNQ